MSEPLRLRKEVIVKEDGRTVILYSFERAPLAPSADADKSDKPKEESAAP